MSESGQAMSRDRGANQTRAVNHARRSGDVTHDDRPMPSATPDMPLLIDAKRASLILSISPRKLWEMTNAGQIPSLRIGRAVRYSVSALREWVDAQERRRAKR